MVEFIKLCAHSASQCLVLLRQRAFRISALCCRGIGNRSDPRQRPLDPLDRMFEPLVCHDMRCNAQIADPQEGAGFFGQLGAPMPVSSLRSLDLRARLDEGTAIIESRHNTAAQEVPQA